MQIITEETDRYSVTDVPAVIGRPPIPVGIMAVAVVSSFIVLFTTAFSLEPQEGSATVSIRDRTFEIHYRFSDMQARVLDTRFDKQISAIVMNVDVPNDTEFSTHFPVALLGAMQGGDSEGEGNPYWHFRYTADFLVDGEPATVGGQGIAGLETRYGIHLDGDAKTVQVLSVLRTN